MVSSHAIELGRKIGGPLSWEYPNGWLVYVMENPMEMDDLEVAQEIGNSFRVSLSLGELGNRNPNWGRGKK